MSTSAPLTVHYTEVDQKPALVTQDSLSSLPLCLSCRTTFLLACLLSPVLLILVPLAAE